MISYFRKHPALKYNLLWLVWAVLYAFVYPVYNLPFLIWFIFIPVLIFIYKQPAHKSLNYAYFYSLAFWLLTLFWLLAFHEVSMPLITPVYSLYHAFAFTIIILLARQYPKIRFLFLPMVWVSIELLRSTGYLGFKWNLVGDAMWQTPVLMQTADIWGVYGLSFIILLVNAVLAEFFFHWMEDGDIISSLKKNKIPLSITAGIMSFVLIYGVITYRKYDKITQESPQHKVALMQPNVGSFEPWFNDRWKHYYDVWEMHAEASLQEPDIMVWSETMLRSFVDPYLRYNPLHPNRVIVERYLRLAREFEVYVLAAHPSLEGKQPFNTVELINPKGVRVKKFSKIHLTPFGEWFPLYQYIPIVNEGMKKLGAGQYAPAKDFTIFKVKNARFAAMICFEDVFGLMARKFVRRGVNYFLNSTNDGWAYRWNVGSDYPLWQHIAGVVGVAVSVRRPIARAVNTGVTGIVDATGDIRVSPVPLYERGVHVDNIAIIDENIQTVYVRFGYLFPYAVMIALFGFVIHLVFFTKPGETIKKGKS